MAKLKINSSLTGSEDSHIFEGSGILKDINTIVYKDQEITTTIIKNNNEVEILRRSSSYRLDLYFYENKETIGIYEINNNVLNLPIKTNKIEINENTIEINYIINEVENFKYKINYEVIE